MIQSKNHLSKQSRHGMQSLRNLLEPSMRKQHIWRGVKRAHVIVLWEHVVGKQVAAFSQAKRFQDGILWVEVSDSETAMHLSYQRSHFLRVYQEQFRISNLRDIRFSVGQPQHKDTLPSTQRIPDTPLDTEGEKALARLVQGLGRLESSPELATTTLHTASALVRNRSYRQDQGYRYCCACQVLTPPEHIKQGFCFICQHHRDNIKVQRASIHLSQEPDALLPLLSDDERRVAQLLALDMLEAQLHELLPYVLADNAYRHPFTDAVHRYLAHKQNKTLADVSSDDYAFLPVNMARVVGYW